MPLPWINVGPVPPWLDVERIIDHYATKSGGSVCFLGELTVRTERGRNGPDTYSTAPVAVFWQERLIDPSHSHYFGLYLGRAGLMIADGSSVASGTWNGLMHKTTGEIVFSRYVHDFRHPSDESFFVDGGRDYFKTTNAEEAVTVRLSVIDGWWTVVAMNLDSET